MGDRALSPGTVGIARGWTVTFYRGTDLLGHLMVSIGFLDIRHYSMTRDAGVGGPTRGLPFPDKECRADVTVPAVSFLEKPQNTLTALLDQVAYSFDLPPVPLPA